jgi:hypothetical protein
MSEGAPSHLRKMEIARREMVTLSSLTVSLVSMVNTVLAPDWLGMVHCRREVRKLRHVEPQGVLGYAEVGDLVVPHNVGEREGVVTGAAGENRASGVGDDQEIGAAAGHQGRPGRRRCCGPRALAQSRISPNPANRAPSRGPRGGQDRIRMTKAKRHPARRSSPRAPLA